MVGDPFADGAILFLLLIYSTLVSAFEAALQSVSRTELEEQSVLSDPRAVTALKLKANAEALRATSKVIVTFALVLSTFVSAPYIRIISDTIALAFHPESAWVVFVLESAFAIILSALIVSAYLSIVVLYARSLGKKHALNLSIRFAGFMSVMVRLVSLPAKVISGTANILLKPNGWNAQFIDSVTSEEGLKDILQEGTKSGIIDKTEHELIESIFDFTETTAREVMIPRTEIVAIEMDMEPDRIFQMVVEEGFTRMPLFKESIDNIIGVVYAKDVLSLVQHRDLIILDDIIRPAFYVPETKPIPELLRDFQRKRQHIAIVIDEFGGTQGLITMEDILEEIVGEIQDEYDEEEHLVEEYEDASIVVQAKMNISEFNEQTNFSIPESEDYETIGGFVTAIFGRIPEKDDTIRYGNIEISVLEVEDRRIVAVQFKTLPSEESKKE